jgi:hypothetical protein
MKPHMGVVQLRWGQKVTIREVKKGYYELE